MSQLQFFNEEEFLAVTRKIESAMTSYAHFGAGSYPQNYAELFYTLLYSHEIIVYENLYVYDFHMKENPEIMRKYMALLPKTRWRTDTQIEKVRLNAIKVFDEFDGADCFENCVIYPQIKAMVYCGDMKLYNFFGIFRDDEMSLYTTFHIFPYPYIQDEDANTSAYYSFVLSSTAVDKIKRFLDGEWERMARIVSGMYNKEN